MAFRTAPTGLPVLFSSTYPGLFNSWAAASLPIGLRIRNVVRNTGKAQSLVAPRVAFCSPAFSPCAKFGNGTQRGQIWIFEAGLFLRVKGLNFSHHAPCRLSARQLLGRLGMPCPHQSFGEQLKKKLTRYQGDPHFPTAAAVRHLLRPPKGLDCHT